MSDVRPIEYWTLFFSILATVIPLILYGWSQRRKVTITGVITSGPANKSINGYKVHLTFKAQNTGKKEIHVNDFKVYLKHNAVIRPVSKYPLTLKEDEVYEIYALVEALDLKIDKVVLIDSLNKEWTLPQEKLNQLVNEVNNRIASME